MPNFMLIIEYDGTAYHGWQYQANAATIQQTLEEAIAVMTRETARVHGSGRTDAGVHAIGQVAHFHTRARIPPEGFKAGLNSLLPHDIVIRSCRQVDDKFHARFDARGKTYQYRILNQSLPAAIGRNYVWQIRRELDIAAMQAAARHIIGTHDFKSFEGSGSPRHHCIRTVFDARIDGGQNGLITFDIRADGFLRYMVRNLTGTLVDVGRCAITPDDFGDILEAQDRRRAGATAPPQGLFLVEVFYGEQGTRPSTAPIPPRFSP